MLKRVLVAPLNWGLGHATRSIPVIQELLQQGAEVVLASDGRAYQLLQQEFPNMLLEKMPAYNIQYPTHNMLWNMLLQLPKMLVSIWREHWHLQKLVEKHHITHVISDSRFGCFSRKAKTTFITHQMNIRLPNLLGQGLVRLANRSFINCFDTCWIPDIAGDKNLAGALAHPALFSKAKYIGILSRMQAMQAPKKYDALVVLSGPEPQRTRLEEMILQQIAVLPGDFLVVQGKPEAGENKGIWEWGNRRIGGWEDKEIEELGNWGRVEVVSFLDGTNLNEAMAASEMVICRSGYSTIMDLAVLGKKAVFIPTPGQTEQEYLAERLLNQGFFYYQKQTDLNVAAALEKGKDFSGFSPPDYQHSSTMLQTAVHDFLN